MSGARDEQSTAEVAVQLAVAAKRFRSRIREEAGVTTTGLSELQLAILIRLRNEGAATAASLAESEHVTQQAIAQTLSALKADSLVQAHPDPKDGRKSLMSITEAGRRLLDSVRLSRDTWLSQAIEAGIAPGEQASLTKAIELLERLADIDIRPHRARPGHEPPAAPDAAEHATLEGESAK